MKEEIECVLGSMGGVEGARGTDLIIFHHHMYENLKNRDKLSLKEHVKVLPLM